MLRVGLTGGLGSGKSTAADIFASLGAHVFSADAIGRELMQPGQPVFREIVSTFGPVYAPDARLVLSDGSLDRSAIARIVFADPVALDRLNRIVHPAVVAEQQRRMNALSTTHPDAIAVVESALIFEVERDQTAPGWSRHFDRIVLLTAPDELKIARYLDRIVQARAAQHSSPPTPAELAALTTDARRRIAAQIPDADKIPRANYVIANTGSLADLQAEIHSIYIDLQTG
jgi:dephospho-CoA kinase